MSSRRSAAWFLGAGLALAAAAPAFAANQTVTVLGGSQMAFSPATVTINKGESVTFTYAGGQLPHNVVADDNSFSCAKGCSDTGGNDTPTSSAFTFTRTFNSAGTIGYYCAVHGGLNGGMRGTIVVNDVATTQGQPIVGGISGNWNDPTPGQSGHGFQFEVLPGNGMLAIWFVFNPAGTAQSWIYSQGAYEAGSSDVVLAAFLEQGQGGAFPPNFDSSKLAANPWGTLEFKFTDCDHGTAEWTPNEAAVNAGYQHVAFPIQRVTHILGATCP